MAILADLKQEVMKELGIMRLSNLLAFIVLMSWQVAGLQISSWLGESCFVNKVWGIDPPIDQLGSGRFADRQAALRDVWASPEAARKAIEQAKKDGDPEMAARARWILYQWERGLTPSTPPEVRRALIDNSEENDPDVLLDLLFEGVPEPLMLRLRENDTGALETTSAALDDAFLRLAIPLLQSDRADLLLEILDLCAARPVHAAMRAELMRKLGKSKEEQKQLPVASKKWSEWDRQVAEVWLNELVEDDATARRLAIKYQLPKLVLHSLLLREDWGGIANVCLEQAKQTNDGTQYGWWATALCAARLCDQASIYDEALSVLSEANPDPAGTTDVAAGLILAGENERAVKVLKSEDISAIVQLLRYQQRYTEALAALSIHPQTFEADLTRFIDETKKLSSRTQSLEYLRKLESSAYAAELAYFVGKHRESFAAYQKLSELQIYPGQSSLGWVITRLPYQKQEDWRIDLVAPHLAANRLNALEALTTIQTRGATWRAASLAWRTLEVMMPEETIRNRARIIYAFALGQLPQGWARRGRLDEFAMIASELLKKAPPVQRGSREMSDADSAMYRTLTQLGRSDLAELFADDESSPQWNPEFAQTLYQYGAYSEAARVYRNQFQSGLGGESHESLVGWLVSLERSGVSEEVESLRKAVRLLPLNGKLHFWMARAYREFELSDRETEHLNEAWRLSEPLQHEEELYRLTRTMLEDPKKLKVWGPRALISMFSPFGQQNLETRSLIQIYQTAVLTAANTGRDLVDDQKVDEARGWLLWAQKMHPMEVDLAEHVTPKLREAGHTALADRMVNTIVAVSESQLQQFPDDPSAANNLAWVLALNSTQLDRALELANLAVRRIPDSTAYRDTLAETLFRLGKVEQAYLVERDCLIDTPDDWHLNKQTERYRRLLNAKP